jgi:hypothetical protein
MAKLEYRPRVEFMELLVDECEARGLEGFNAQDLANVLNGEDRADRPTTFQAKAVCEMIWSASPCHRVRQAGVLPWRRVHGPVRRCVHGDAAAGVQPYGYCQRDQR